jgi:hypothetical protein
MDATAAVADAALWSPPPTASPATQNNSNAKRPGVSLNAAGALRRFTVRHTWPLPHLSTAGGDLSASVGLRYDPDLQRRGGGLLQSLGLASSSSSSPADGAELTAQLVWRSRDGLARLSVSDAEATAKRGWRFSAGPVTGVLAAELRYPLFGEAAPRRDPLTGVALPSGAPDPPRVLMPSSGALDADAQQRRRAPKLSLSVDDVKPLWAYGLAVGGALLMGAPVSLVGKDVSIGLPRAGGVLPRRLAGFARGSARHRGWLSYELDVDELGGALEIGPLLKLGGGNKAA